MTSFFQYLSDTRGHKGASRSHPPSTCKQVYRPHVERLEAREVLNSTALSGQRMLEGYGQLPLSFEANHGQADSQVRFLSRGPGYALFLTPQEAVLSLHKPEDLSAACIEQGCNPDTVVRMGLVGANTAPLIPDFSPRDWKEAAPFGIKSLAKSAYVQSGDSLMILRSTTSATSSPEQKHLPATFPAPPPDPCVAAQTTLLPPLPAPDDHAARTLQFQPQGPRTVLATFDGEALSADAGALLLAEVEHLTGILRQFASCFTDYRDPDLIEHTVSELLAQRVYGLVLGYEDLNDHDRLRCDPLLATLVGKLDPTGQARARVRDQGKSLAGKSTLNRLELTAPEPAANERYQKIVAHHEAIAQFFLDLFFQSQPQTPTTLVLDLDTTPDRLHGHQEGRFWHGHYRDYCYLPLYVFCGQQLLCARLLTADSKLSAAGLDELQRLVAALRARWPEVTIIVRADGGFGGDELLCWCEAQDRVEYVLGYAENSRLLGLIANDLLWAHVQHLQTGVPARLFGDLEYQTRDSWSRARRVVYKAEHLPLGPNPRFVVTSLTATTHPAQALYENFYCARGAMENRIKEQKLDLKSDRTSTSRLRANQLRLWFASVGYVLLETLRRLGLAATPLRTAQCGTIRSLLLKVSAVVRVTARTIKVTFARGWPLAGLFQRVVEHLHSQPPQFVAPTN